jgi:hypothetical protein
MDTFFTVKIDDKDVELEIKAATIQDQREATKVYNQAFSDAVSSGSIVRAKLDDLLKEQGLWNDKKDIEFKTIHKQILDNEKKLKAGGISLNAGKNIALEIQKLRNQLRDLMSDKSQLDTHTAEGQADNARFNYLVSACTVYKNTSKKYFKSYEDYLNRATESASFAAAQKLASLMYGVDNDFEKKLPENKFLIKYKFVNDDLHFVNKDGKLIDAEGRLVDEQGRYINEEGKFVDRDGNLIDETGEFVVEFKPFLDDEGNPIAEPNDEQIKTNEPQQEQPVSE